MVSIPSPAMLEVAQHDIEDRLAFDNPWWEAGTNISGVYRNWPRRDYFPAFQRLVEQTGIVRAVVLMGPRRVGKTIMAYHAIQSLLDAGVRGDHILYVSLETPLYTGLPLERLLKLFRDRFKHARDRRLYVFFDEVQYLKDWEVHLKSLVDSYREVQFVATGSAAAALRLKSRESGAGRFTEFLLPPLTFAEYLRFAGRLGEIVGGTDEAPELLDVEALNAEFVNYLNYGGYPEAVLSELVRADTPRYIKSDIVDKVLLRDLPSLYGIADIQELNRLFTVLALNTGQEVSLDKLSKNAGVAKNTIRKYLEYLEAAFLIRRLRRIDQHAKQFKREVAFKVYLTNPSIRAALFGFVGPDDQAMGALVETALLSQWMHGEAHVERLFYARWGEAEVDLVYVGEQQKPDWAVEVKWSDRVLTDNAELRGMLRFLDAHPLHRGTVTTRTKTSIRAVGAHFLYHEPSAWMAYLVGLNLLKDRRDLAVPMLA